MANITRYSPFSDPMDEMFKNFMSRPMRFLEDEAGMQMRTVVSEDDKNHTIKADIPGVKKEDIKVSINGNRVSIRAETKKETEEKQGSKVIRSERYFGKVFRAMTLDSDVDQETAYAKFSNGVLILTLPKKDGGASKQITVK